MRSAELETALASRLLICITCLYRPERLRYLYQVLRSVSDFLVARMDVVVVTDTSAPDEVSILQRMLHAYFPAGAARVQSFEVADPKDLTWRHKQVLRDVFLGGGTTYTHFLYLEDDILFSYRNFLYFLRYRHDLGRLGLVPSFVRVEYQEADHRFYATDLWYRVALDTRRVIELGDCLFTDPAIPHLAMFLMDHALAEEHVRSPSFDPELSGTMGIDYGYIERSAMGIAFDNVPEGFRTRCVIPLDPTTRAPRVETWIYHLPNTYANEQATPLATIPVEEVYC